MKMKYDGFTRALDEVSASSAGGAPFLICYGVTFILTGILSYMLPRETSALLVMFQGAVALPAALWLERRMGTTRITADNPLNNLSMLLAVSQGLAIPFLIVIYNINPGQIPVVMAGLGGVHFLPYGWLHRNRIYIALAVIISVGSFALVLGLSTLAYEIILLFVGIVYLIAAPLVHRHSRQLISQAAG
ncbi:MAG: hypothetical protein PVI99_07460 [Anaerolineales bacterium]|jgi:hypothetical protein